MAGEVMRDALARAVAVEDELKPRDWRVLAACFAVVSSYSKVWDNVYLDQLVQASGVSRGRVSESLRRLHDHQVVAWTPSRGHRGSRLDLSGLI